MAEHECTDELFLGVLVLLGIDTYGVGGADALIAGAGVGHDGNHRSSHTGIAGRGGARDDVRIDGVAEDALGQWTVDGLAEVMAVVALDGLACRVHIILAGILDETDFFEGSSGGEVVDETEVQLKGSEGV